MGLFDGNFGQPSPQGGNAFFGGQGQGQQPRPNWASGMQNFLENSHQGAPVQSQEGGPPMQGGGQQQNAGNIMQPQMPLGPPLQQPQPTPLGPPQQQQPQQMPPQGQGSGMLGGYGNNQTQPGGPQMQPGGVQGGPPRGAPLPGQSAGFGGGIGAGGGFAGGLKPYVGQVPGTGLWA